MATYFISYVSSAGYSSCTVECPLITEYNIIQSVKDGIQKQIVRDINILNFILLPEKESEPSFTLDNMIDSFDAGVAWVKEPDSIRKDAYFKQTYNIDIP